jgi:HSP20 family protein
MARYRRVGSWDAESELAHLQREMNRMTRPASKPVTRQGRRVFPAIIISATNDKLLVRTEVPGMDPEDLHISVSDDTLTVQGSRTTGEQLEGGWYHRRERESGGFSRAVRLAAEVDGDKAEATYVAGVLTISLPLKKAAKPREIPVKVVEG